MLRWACPWLKHTTTMAEPLVSGAVGSAQRSSAVTEMLERQPYRRLDRSGSLPLQPSLVGVVVGLRPFGDDRAPPLGLDPVPFESPGAVPGSEVNVVATPGALEGERHPLGQQLEPLQARPLCQRPGSLSVALGGRAGPPDRGLPRGRSVVAASAPRSGPEPWTAYGPPGAATRPIHRRRCPVAPRRDRVSRSVSIPHRGRAAHRGRRGGRRGRARLPRAHGPDRDPHRRGPRGCGSRPRGRAVRPDPGR